MLDIKPQASEEAVRAFVDGLQDFLRKDDPLLKDLQALAHEGIRAFTLTLDDVRDHQGAERAKFVGWRFLATAPSGDVLAADVRGALDSKATRLTSVSRDREIVSRLVEAARKLPELRDLKAEGAYELRILRIPGMLIEAFWLFSKNGGIDYVVPVLTRAKELELLHPYTMNQFLDIVRPLAKKFLMFDEY